MTVNQFAPFITDSSKGTFVVKNIADPKKTVRIFQYPILSGGLRDLLKIPGVSESDIRASLLKGELRNKILSGEVHVISSDVDLLQFNLQNKMFLQDAGITRGLEVGAGEFGAQAFTFKQMVNLIGLRDGVNGVFTVPAPDKFIQGSLGQNIFKISILHNGAELIPDVDYEVSESGGVGTGYDTVTIISFIPVVNSILLANYVVAS